MADKKKNIGKQIFLFVSAGALLVLGVALIVAWWAYVGVIFKGAAGIVLSLAGIILLALVRD